MSVINASLLADLPLPEIEHVTFYKQDEITTDLICCDISLRGEIRSFHEEMPGWDILVHHLERLPGFRSDWFAAVSQPPFLASETIAFRRP